MRPERHLPRDAGGPDPGRVVALRPHAILDQPKTRHGDLDALDDHRLVVLCLAGDEAAWESLVLRYRRLIYAIAIRSGVDDDEADDIFLETFARLLDHLDQLDHPRRIRSWLVTTARRLSLDACARNGRFVRTEEAGVGICDPQESILTEIERVCERDLVHRALDRLGVECRHLLDLLYGLSRGRPRRYREVAERLGVSIGSVGPRRARCLDSLRVEMRRLELGRSGPRPPHGMGER